MRSVIVAATLAVFAGGTLAACEKSPPPLPREPDTLAVEEKAGDFLDYYEEVLRLTRAHPAQADSFRAALAALPGSHLDDEEWEAWTRPYRAHPDRLANRVEEILAGPSVPRP